jgi:hypothetical protein
MPALVAGGESHSACVLGAAPCRALGQLSIAAQPPGAKRLPDARITSPERHRGSQGSIQQERLSEIHPLDAGHFAWEQASEDYGRLIVDWVTGGFQHVGGAATA